MLRQRINVNELKNDAVDLNVSKINITNIINSNNLLTSTKVVVCTYDDNISLKNVNEVIGINDYVLCINDTVDDSTVLNNYEEKTEINNYDITNSVNYVNNTFAFSIPFLYSFTIKNIIYNDMDKTNPFIYITFNSSHYFTAVKPNVSDEKLDINYYLWKYIDSNYNDVYYLLANETELKEYENDVFEKICQIEILTSTMFRFAVKDKVNINDFFLTEIQEDGNETIVNYDATLKFFRPNFLFSDWGTNSFFYYDYKCKLAIPLSTKQQIDLVKENLLNEYIEDAKQRSINKIVDMEKDIYYPVIYEGEDSYKNVYKLKFNFHFIRRDNENWTSETANLWNGVEVENDKLILSNNFFVYNKKEEQSDLLCYLNFTNNDVKYQKNKLKKSFIRLSFYDSPNMGNQNMLAYSTIFLNGGEYFNKYIKYIETKDYKTTPCNSQPATDEQQWNTVIYDTPIKGTGIRVDREPSERNNEDMRLSSQVTVSDKYNSDASSEGFYLYLWKDLLPLDEIGKKGTQTVYMKVEFNHAGYGRVIPFMMPYWDNKKWDDIVGIKSFQEIIDDWNDTSEELTTDGQYGAKQYIKFSYIKIKIGYDENEKKYIYYLDNDVYGKVIPTEANVLTFNLYEAKMV